MINTNLVIRTHMCLKKLFPCNMTLYVLIGVWTLDVKQIKLDKYISNNNLKKSHNLIWYSKMGLFKFSVGFFHFY